MRGTHFSDVHFVELEDIFRVFLEWILATLGLLQWILGDLLLVAVEGDEHFGVRTSTAYRASLRRHHELRFYEIEDR